MSRARHKRASGGDVPAKVSGNPKVFEEAAERKKGGRAKRATGGKVETKDVGLMTGGAVRPRLDRPGRKSGGRVGSNSAPLSTAHASTSIGKQPKTQEGGAS